MKKKPKKRYEKPKMTVKKLTPFFFNCLQIGSKCTTVVSNKKVGGTPLCPNA